MANSRSDDDDSPRLKPWYRKGRSPMVLAGTCALVVIAGVAFSATRNTTATAPAAMSSHLSQPRSTPAQRRVELQSNASPAQTTPASPGRATLSPVVHGSPATQVSPGQVTPAIPQQFTHPSPAVSAVNASSPLPGVTGSCGRYSIPGGPGPELGPVPGEVGWWPLWSTCGSQPLVPDQSISGSSAPSISGTPSNVQFTQGWDGYALFGGQDSQIIMPDPVVNTGPGESFTVMADVWLSRTGSFETAVSEGGAVNSAFYLQYSAADNRWAFSRVASDTPNSPGIRALSAQPPALDTWTQLAGVYNASDHQLQLYVNGVLQGTATDTTPFAADAIGKFVIGRALFNGQWTDWFDGRISNVMAFNQALTPQEMKWAVTDAGIKEQP
jgi:hypothetical protein